MSPEELSESLEKLETQIGYALGNQVSILEQQELLNKLTKKLSKKLEITVILNYFLLSLVFYGVLQVL